MLVERKTFLNVQGNELINLMFMFASSRPKSFGVYKNYAADELEELLAHYQHDLIDAAEKADADHITRLA
jgi:hypothetical protein